MGFLDRFRKKDAPKPRADFSGVRTGASTTAPRPPAPAPPRPSPPADRTHVVAPGESLSKIAKKYYGDAERWPEIHEANRDTVKDPDLIHPGQKLRIPGA
jgi:nucleoid-associated protein YgaU